MAESFSTQVAVIGGGPGGHAAAFLAADLGLQVTLIDNEPNPGGICTYRGCIPSKALLHVAKLLGETKHAAAWGLDFGEPKIDVDTLRGWKNGIVQKLTGGLGQLAKQRKVRYVRGRASFVDATTLTITLHREEGGDASGAAAPSVRAAGTAGAAGAPGASDGGPDASDGGAGGSDRSGDGGSSHPTSGGGEERLTFEKCIIATGSRPIALPNVTVSAARLLDSTSALDLTRVPSTLLVVGGGYIGLELGTVYAALGSKVTVVEMTDGLLPGADRDLVNVLAKRLTPLFASVMLSTKVVKMEEQGDGVKVTFEGVKAQGADGTGPDRTSPDQASPDRTSRDRASADQASPDRTSADRTDADRTDADRTGAAAQGVDRERAAAPTEQVFDQVLVAIGRRPNGQVPGLDRTRVEVDARGFIKVDAQRRTAEPTIYAIGDVAGEPMLAHKATHEGKVAAEAIAGHKVAFEPQAIPAVVFTDPEIAWCGLTETDAKKQGIEVAIAKFPWGASGRATTLDRNDGLTKLVLDPKTERVLGVGIVGVGAGELIAEGVLAVEMAATARDVSLSIHPHPTLTETVMESAEVFYGQATNFYRPKRK